MESESKQRIIIEKLLLTNERQKEIASLVEVSESYVSQIATKLNQLQTPPKIIDHKVVCAKCEKEFDLFFHHNHGTNEIIALVCRSCNTKLDNYLFVIPGDVVEFFHLFLFQKSHLPSPFNCSGVLSSSQSLHTFFQPILRHLHTA